MTESDLIERLGGPTVVAALLGTNQNTVSNWHKRGFPAWAHRILIRECEARGIEYDETLFEAKPKAPQRGDASAERAAE